MQKTFRKSRLSPIYFNVQVIPKNRKSKSKRLLSWNRSLPHGDWIPIHRSRTLPSSYPCTRHIDIFCKMELCRSSKQSNAVKLTSSPPGTFCFSPARSRSSQYAFRPNQQPKGRVYSTLQQMNCLQNSLYIPPCTSAHWDAQGLVVHHARRCPPSASTSSPTRILSMKCWRRRTCWRRRPAMKEQISGIHQALLE